MKRAKNSSQNTDFGRFWKSFKKIDFLNILDSCAVAGTGFGLFFTCFEWLYYQDFDLFWACWRADFGRFWHFWKSIFWAIWDSYAVLGTGFELVFTYFWRLSYRTINRREVISTLFSKFSPTNNHKWFVVICGEKLCKSVEMTSRRLIFR